MKDKSGMIATCLNRTDEIHMLYKQVEFVFDHEREVRCQKDPASSLSWQPIPTSVQGITFKKWSDFPEKCLWMKAKRTQGKKDDVKNSGGGGRGEGTITRQQKIANERFCCFTLSQQCFQNANCWFFLPWTYITLIMFKKRLKWII